MNYRKQFKIDCPETVGEKDSAYDDSNYIDWLEKTLDNTLKQVENLSLADVGGSLPTDEEIQIEADKWFKDPRTRDLRRHDWKNGVYWLRDMRKKQ